MGRIVGSHGLKGDLKVALLTDFPEALLRRRELLLGEGHRRIAVTRSRQAGPTMVLQLDGIESRDDADALRGEFLYVPVSEAHRPSGEHFVHELIGLSVTTIDGMNVGTLIDVLKTGANDVYVVRDDLGEQLVPAIADVVTSIDLTTGRMIIRPVPGLLRGG